MKNFDVKKEIGPLLAVSCLAFLPFLLAMVFGIGEAGKEWSKRSGLADSAIHLGMVYLVILFMVVASAGSVAVLLRKFGKHEQRHYLLTTFAIVTIALLANELPKPAGQLPAAIFSVLAGTAAAAVCVRIYWGLRRPDRD